MHNLYSTVDVLQLYKLQDKRIGIPITVQTAHKTEIEEIASEKALNKMLAIFITNYSKICGSYTKEEMEYKEPDSM